MGGKWFILTEEFPKTVNNMLKFNANKIYEVLLYSCYFLLSCNEKELMMFANGFQPNTNLFTFEKTRPKKIT